MGIRSEAGFTVIETILFLAITSALILMIIAGTGASLNVQRYRDSVESFKSLLQQQYTSLSNVQNGRENTWSCTSTAIVIEDSTTPEDRGQSNCVLVGKYIRIDRGDVTTYTVLANQTQAVPAGASDIQAMTNSYALNIAPDSIEDRKLEWGTQIAWARAGTLDQNNAPTPRTMGILIVRSPHTGQTYTFTTNTIPARNAVNPTTFTSMMNSSNQRERMVCVDSSGWVMSENSGVYLGRNASTINSVEVRTNSSPAIGSTRC